MIPQNTLRTPHSALRTQKGFTLIQMLVVIAIIAILAGLMFPAITKAMDSARRSKAEAEVKAIATAVALFYNDHGYLPAPGVGPDTPFPGNVRSDQGGPWADFSKNVLRVLTNDNTSGMAEEWATLNRYNKVYLNLENPGEEPGEVLDPWGGQYAVMLDRDLDGMITYLSTERRHRTRAVAISAGRSRQFDGGPGNRNRRDNVANVDLIE